MDLLHTKLWFMCAGNKCEANLENNHKGRKRKTAKQKELKDWKKGQAHANCEYSCILTLINELNVFVHHFKSKH